MRYFVIVFVLVLGIGFGSALWGKDLGVRPYHYSAFGQRDFFEDAYTRSKDLPSPAHGSVKGLLVNHHLLAPHFIAQGFGLVESQDDIKTVLLVSPNHFDVGDGQITTSAQTWHTPYGLLEPNLDLIDHLRDAGLVTVDERPFAKEHGISNLVSFIKRSLPDAYVVPLILKETITPGQVQRLSDQLKFALPKNGLVVASVDMSHYVAEEVAAQQDQNTLRILRSSDLSGVWQAAADSPASLYLTMELMRSNGSSFSQLQRSSSALLVKDVKPADNTSYITGYWE